VPFDVTTNDLLDNGPVANSRITWTDDVAGAGFGHGSAFGDTTLAPGDHHISVTAVDSRGGERTAGPITIHVVVEPPHVEIDHPADATTYGNDQTISFRGEAIDPEQGDIGPSATWSLDGTAIGTGHTITKTLTGSSCQIYTHHVTVTALDTGNSQSATDEVTVNDGGIC
jgi:hypothetical protein